MRNRTRAASERAGAFIGKAGTLAERFWRYVDKAAPEECWLWRGGTNNCGYGTIGLGGVTEKGTARMGTAHRVSWELHQGPIPRGASVLHRCDTPRCVNPDHLFLGTKRDNTLDALAKGRHTSPRNLLHGKARP